MLLHLIVEVAYLIMSRYHLSTEDTRDVIYFVGDPLCFAISLLAIIICLVYIGLDRKDIQFILIHTAVCFIRAVCYGLNFLHLMNNSCNLLALLIGTALATMIVLISGGRHGYFNEED